jgi:hypothetical protein
MQRLPKGRSYPLHRAAIEEFLSGSNATFVCSVTFRPWPRRPLVEATFQGRSRRTPSAGKCSVEINSIPDRDVATLEPAIRGEVIPKFLEWFQVAKRLAESAPKDLSSWEVRFTRGWFVYGHRLARP